MKIKKLPTKDLYYTTDHEWIDFQGSVAYIGVCQFKLLGFKGVHRITFSEDSGFKKKTDVIATIKYNDYQIEVHMPVDGKIVELNENLLAGNHDTLLQQPESTGWIAKIVPSQPYERKDLLLPQQYQMNGKSKHAKG
jgi:glycine cleavage system H lipoate-binding protein